MTTYRIWLYLGRVGCWARWRLAAETDSRPEANRLAASIRAAAGRSAVLAIEYRPPPVAV